MKRTALILLVIVSTFAAAACSTGAEESKAAPAISPVGTAAANPEDTKQAITRLEREWVAAILAKDDVAIDRLLVADFVGTTNSQKYSKGDAIADVKTGVHESLELTDVDVRVFGDAAVATMTQNEKSRHGNEDFSGRYLFTDVWIKTNGNWLAVASHGSRAR